MINVVIGRMIFEGKQSVWIVGAFEEFHKALQAKRADYWRIVGDDEQEASIVHLPDYEIIQLPPNDTCFKELI